MTCFSDICARWVDVALGRTNKANFSSGRSNVFARGDKIFSYGSHFEMGRLLRDRKGAPRAFLLNGDRYSVTTAKHQSYVRAAMAKADLPHVIIPHSALSAASIDFETVEIVEATADRLVETEHVTFEQPAGSRWEEVIDREYGELPAEQLEALVAKRNASAEEYSMRDARYCQEQGVSSVRAKPEVITVDDLEPWDRRGSWPGGSRMVLRPARSSWQSIDVEVLEDGRTKFSWTTSRHWLGESLIRARVDGVWQYRKCVDCKGTRTTENGYCVPCGGVGTVRRRSRNRWAYFLSGFDHNETREVYFFCELPRGVHPTTVDEAYDALKPEAVKVAEQVGRTVHRQGDIFAIEMRVSKRELRASGARFEKRGNLLRTNHEATEVAYMPDGSTLVRGTLWHNPGFRDPDHRRVTVGKAWHLAVKNRVPIAK